MRTAYPVAMLAAAAVSLLLAGCGGGSTPDAAASGSSASPASSAPTATATASAVSTPVTKAEFLVKFKTEPDTGELSPADIDCVVGVYLKYVDKHELRQYVDGEITIDDFTEPDDSAGAEQDMLAAWPTRCLSTEDSGRDGEPDGHRAGRSVASRGSIRRGPCHMMFVKVILL